jgi:antitoxin (DNA-binding transcriptional repressor) of toxin-antitoxin stability system
MKMGVREFRSRISEVLRGSEPVELTSNGRVVAEVRPVTPRPPADDIDEWRSRRLAFRDRWRETTPDWLERLTEFGVDEEGYPLADPPFR